MILSNKRHHKLLALFLALTLFCGVLFSANFGLSEVKASNAIAEGIWGDNITWEFDGSTLTVRGQGRMKDAPITWEDYTYTIHVPWPRDVQKIVIGEGITHIGKANFAVYYQALETIVLPNSLTSIGDVAFEHNKKLRTVNLPSNLKSIGDFAFYNCTKLQNVTLPNTLTQAGTSAFSSCDTFTAITIPPSLKTVKGSFSGCKNLTSVKISNGVNKIGKEAFAECPKLKTINLPASVSNIGAMAFDDCNKLANVKIRNKNCKIDSHPLTFPKKTIIYGYKNSTAEKYAKKHNLKFKTLSGSSSSKTIKVKKLKITNVPKTLKAGRSKTLKVKVTPSNATKKSVTWKSSNKKYATINSKGRVTAKKAGKGKTVKITAVAKDGSKKNATVKIKIK